MSSVERTLSFMSLRVKAMALVPRMGRKPGTLIMAACRGNWLIRSGTDQRHVAQLLALAGTDGTAHGRHDLVLTGTAFRGDAHGAGSKHGRQVLSALARRHRSHDGGRASVTPGTHALAAPDLRDLAGGLVEHHQVQARCESVPGRGCFRGCPCCRAWRPRR